jgi:hypothetical protein
VEINGSRVGEVVFPGAGLAEILVHVGKVWRRMKVH